MWRLLHCVAWGWEHRRLAHKPVDRKAWAKRHVSMFTSLTCVLPCKKCCTNYADTIRSNRPTEYKTLQKNGLTRWLYQVHRTSRKKHNKSSPPFASVARKYKDGHRCQRIWSVDGWHAVLLTAATFPVSGGTTHDTRPYPTFYTHLSQFSPIPSQRRAFREIANTIHHKTTRRELVRTVLRKLRSWNLMHDGTADSVLALLPHWRRYLSQQRRIQPDYIRLCMYLHQVSKAGR